MTPQIRVWPLAGTGPGPSIWQAEVSFDSRQPGDLLKEWERVPGSWLSREEADDAADLFAEKFMRIEVAG